MIFFYFSITQIVLPKLKKKLNKFGRLFVLLLKDSNQKLFFYINNILMEFIFTSVVYVVKNYCTVAYINLPPLVTCENLE